MSFLDSPYGLFLLGLIALHSLVRLGSTNSSTQNKLQTGLILFGSLLFYTTLQWHYLPLLIAITLLNFYLGRAIATKREKAQQQVKETDLSNQEWENLQGFWQRRASRLLVVGIFINVLVLVTFKYIPFLLNTVAATFNFNSAAQSASWFSERLIAPLGISFFTFECIAYLVDVSRGNHASNSLLEFTSYKLFFPKLISGPITRYHQFAKQLELPRYPPLSNYIEGFWLIAAGAVKKALFADQLGIFVDLCFGNLERASSLDLWLAIFAYGLQLYFDFSGYVDIARGSALLLGFHLPENFDFPYFSTSIADFWRRWHMTLGDWLRNYLYFPLGGSRQGLGRTCLNLVLVMLIAGIWHGAAWGYIVWGGLHGIALAVHRLMDSLSKGDQALTKFWGSWEGTLLAWFLTQVMVFTSWLFFRLPNLQQAGLVVQHLVNYAGDIQFSQKVYGQALGLGRYQIFLLLMALAVFMTLVYLLRRNLQLKLNWPVKLILAPLCLYAVWILAPEGGLPYIYFDF